MIMPINLARKFERLESFVPAKIRLPFRYYGQRMLGALEPEMRYLSRLVNPNKVSIDIGANKGIYAYELSKLTKHVYCFEPIVELCDYVKLYQSEKITVNNVALSDYSGKATLHIPRANNNLVTTRASLISDRADMEERVVLVETLDSFQLSDVGFIKIDVEGAELSVLKGAYSTIKKNMPVMLVEISSSVIVNSASRSELIGLFNELGYRVSRVQGGLIADIELDAISVNNSTGSANFIFFPADSG